MNDIIAESEAQRRIKVGLSPALLEHAADGQQFLGFISYRRRDGLALAKWLRDRITSFEAPIELRDKIAAMDASVGGKQNRVFFDMSYQRPNVDFWDEHIAASLCRSRTLLLLQTPSVFERLDDGEPNWCEREIETYLKYYGEPSRILVVMAPGAPIDKFPEPLANISARWDWIDLRFFSESPLQRFRHGGQYDPLLAKILAKIYNIADGDLPLLNREFAKSRARVRRVLAAAACLAIVSLSGLTAWALRERDRASAAEQVAVEQRDAAIRQRNAALIAQSRFLAKSADEQSNAGSARAAVAILREALPDPAAGRDRPLVTEAVASAYRAIYDNRERGRLPMPSDAAAVTSDGNGGRIVIATPDRLIIRNGIDPAPQQEWSHDFGPAKSLALSASGKSIVMIAANGAIMVRDLTDNRLILRDPGMGRNTIAAFVQNGAKLLVSSPDQPELRLFDLDQGTVIATRDLAPAKGRPVVSYVDQDFIALVADATLLRLSPDDLTTLASVAVPDVAEFAFALSPDRRRIYVAAAEQLAKGSVLALDAATLRLERSFGRLSFGAKFMSASPTHDFLAVNGASGVDFFDTKNFDTIGHVTTVPLTGGRFLRDSFFYIAFNIYGDILQLVPELLTTTAYKTIDGGSIHQIDVLADGSGFLSLSDRPSITQWGFDPGTSSRRMTMPFILKNFDLKTQLPIRASDFNKSDDTITAAYLTGSIKRWNVNDGTSKTVKDDDVNISEKSPMLAAMDRGITLVAQPNGMLQVFGEGGGTASPITTLNTGIPSTLAAVSPTTAILVTNNEPKLLDVGNPTKPSLTTLDKLGACPSSGAGLGVAVCLDGNGSLRVLRTADNQLIADMSSPDGGFNAAFATQDGKDILTADGKGNVVWRNGADGATIRQWVLKGTLRGPLLARAFIKGLLRSADITAMRAGATSIDISMSPSFFEASTDGMHVAAVQPNGAIKLLARNSDSIVDIPARDGRFVGRAKFSAHGQYLAVLDHVDDKMARAMLVVYDTASGTKLFAVNVDPEAVPSVQALSNGRGFVTVALNGAISVHPVFDEPADLIAYLAKSFPIPLTTAQRRFFFIE